MKILPNSYHLRFIAILTSLVGIFPSEFLFVDNKFFQKIYSLYSRLMLLIFLILTIVSAMQLQILFLEEVIRIEEVCRNLSITLLFMITFVRQMFMKFIPEFKTIIKDVISSEHEIKLKQDVDLVKIFEECATGTKQRNVIYVLVVSTLTQLHFYRPFFIDDYIQIGNQTVTFRSFPISLRVPFDDQQYYWSAYSINVFLTLFGASVICYTDMLIFSLITCPIGQLQILHHILDNFEAYKNQIKHEFNVQSDDISAFVMFKQCVFMHKNIIKYVDNFNKSMGAFMVIDFLQTSLQISAVVTQLILNDGDVPPFMIYFIAVFIVALMFRVFVSYYYPNEICLLSEGLALSIWKMDWYEQSKDVKYMMQIMMILKASYSYMMLIYRVHNLND